MVIWPS